MLHLVWIKGSGDEARNVHSHLMNCYKSLYLETPENLNEEEAATYIGLNLISLTYGLNYAELTSLEALLFNLMKEGYISDVAIQKLWRVFSARSGSITKAQRRGAIQVLSMLATANPSMIIDEMDSLLQVGLGPEGRRDTTLARHTCIALQKVSFTISGE